MCLKIQKYFWKPLKKSSQTQDNGPWLSSLRVMYFLFFQALLYDITQILSQFYVNRYWHFSRRLIKPVDRYRGLFLQCCMAFEKKQTSKPSIIFGSLYKSFCLSRARYCHLHFSTNMVSQSFSQEKIYHLGISNIYCYLE